MDEHLDPRDRNLSGSEILDRVHELRRDWKRYRSKDSASRLFGFWKEYQVDPGDLDLTLILSAPEWFTRKLHVIITWLRQSPGSFSVRETFGEPRTGGSSTVVLVPEPASAIRGIPNENRDVPLPSVRQLRSLQEVEEFLGPYSTPDHLGGGSDDIVDTLARAREIIGTGARTTGEIREEHLVTEPIAVADGRHIQPGDRVSVGGELFVVVSSDGGAPVQVPLPPGSPTGAQIASAIQAAASGLMAQARRAVEDLDESGGYLMPPQVVHALQGRGGWTDPTIEDEHHIVRGLETLLRLLTGGSLTDKHVLGGVFYQQRFVYENGCLVTRPEIRGHYRGASIGEAVSIRGRSDFPRESFRLCSLTQVRVPWAINRPVPSDLPEDLKKRWPHGWRSVSCEIE